MTVINWQKLSNDGVDLKPRHPFDFYPTNDEHVISHLSLVNNQKPTNVLDVGMGNGVYGQYARKKWKDANIVGVELRFDAPFMNYYDWNVRADFLRMTTEPMFDVVIGNPPYGGVEKIVRHGMRCLRNGGELIFLLRLSFLASMGRYSLFTFDHPPKEVVVCSDRPSFTGDGKTDASEYMFAKWVKGYRGETKISWELSYPCNKDKYGHNQLNLFQEQTA